MHMLTKSLLILVSIINMADELAQNNMRRMPSVQKTISEIKPDDTRVSVIGTVVDIKGNTLVLDDGSGNIQVVFNEDAAANPNQLVRIFGRVMPGEHGVEIMGEILQDMSGLDVAAFKKASSIII